jgi:hypothetical protein
VSALFFVINEFVLEKLTEQEAAESSSSKTVM